jgi:hypothetical protein
MGGGGSGGKLRKAQLRPWDKVEHLFSGSTAEVFPEKDGKLGCIETCVKVRRRLPCGRYSYPIWEVANLRPL